MDARKYMIVDLERPDGKRFITQQVSSVSVGDDGRLVVRFVSSSKIFRYNPARLLCLTNPAVVDLEGKGLYVMNRKIQDVTELLMFSSGDSSYYHVIYANGHYDDFDGRDIYVTRTPIDKTGGNLWEYLNKLAEETGLTTDDNKSILAREYASVDLERDNVPIAQYLGSSIRLHKYAASGCVIYPFGCNASQKKAVENALTNQVSIIQGPPGTGKTQTILNIVANLLMAGKTVLVVSHNNSAVENVAEKLSKENLGFIVAKLGSAENKERFMANQPSRPDMSGWKLADRRSIVREVKDSLKAVSNGFELMTRRSSLKADYDALLKEIRYNDMMGGDTKTQCWLNKKESDKLLNLKHRYSLIVESGRVPGLWFRLKWAFSFGLRTLSFLAGEPSSVAEVLDKAFYSSRKRELEDELASIDSMLEEFSMETSAGSLRDSSLRLLKDCVAHRYESVIRHKFSLHDLRFRSEEFLNEYPVVLSTTYSAKNNIDRDMVFDYVIMDEASQVDIKTGVLALACATNAVIVGDDKQLPNVIGGEETKALNVIISAYKVEDRYNALTHSFLKSCCEVFRGSPVTLLREHYRCHPKIIEFCNHMFYGGELIAMTEDKGETDVIKVIRTAKGNHARDRFNQREIDVINREIMPQVDTAGSLGIITPYRNQAEAINAGLGEKIASTVHKYQGRECDTIIMSMVDNEPSEFSDNPNLMNVALSRAKNHLYIVSNGNDLPDGTILAQLIDYARFNNYCVSDSRLHSVFDLLYVQYSQERLAYERANHSSGHEFLSEQLMYDTIVKAIDKAGMADISVLCHYPLSRLVADRSVLSRDEWTFAGNALAHVDFLIYNSLTKRPLLAIEVDGWHYHRSNVQRSRDGLKDSVLSKIGLPLSRISTADTVDLSMIENMLAAIYA